MGLFDKLFGKAQQSKNIKRANAYFKALTAYSPAFRTWGGELYESELVRAAIDAKARHTMKLSVQTIGPARPTVQSRLRIRPNEFETWSQWLYRTRTILEMQSTCIIVPVKDEFDRPVGIYSVLPTGCEVKEAHGEPYLVFTFANGQKAAERLKECGILSKFLYDQEFFGRQNTALSATMQLIAMQNQGITEGIKNGATFRFMARVADQTFDDDLKELQSRFNRNHLQGESGGVLLFPSDYNDIREISNKPFIVDSEQMKTIQENVYSYFGVNTAVLQNSADGNQLDAFFNGDIEPFSIQLAEVLTNMLFTDAEISRGSAVVVSANRLQYMSVQNKINLMQQAGDRGIMTIAEMRELLNLPVLPSEVGEMMPVRGEYYHVLPDGTTTSTDRTDHSDTYQAHKEDKEREVDDDASEE